MAAKQVRLQIVNLNNRRDFKFCFAVETNPNPEILDQIAGKVPPSTETGVAGGNGGEPNKTVGANTGETGTNAKVDLNN